MAAKLLRSMNGVFSVYKPSELSITGLKKAIVKRICKDGNEMITYKRKSITLPVVQQHDSGALVVVGERTQEDYMLNPLVSGDFFRAEDIILEEMKYLEGPSSGVCVFGLNDGCSQLSELHSNAWTSEYRIEAMFGRETLRHELKGRVTLRVDYDHITRHKLLKLISKIQAQYRSAAFEFAEVDMESQEAYELARKGIPRPHIPGAQLVHNIELTSFNPPYFALHLKCIGESDKFLRHFVHELGVSLGTTACTVRLQRRSIGPFLADMTLLDKQLSLYNILRNISYSRKLLSTTKSDATVIDDEFKLDDLGFRNEVMDGIGVCDTSDNSDVMQQAWPRNYE